MLSIIWTIVIGFVIGVLAKFLHPGRENMGILTTTLLGIAGSFLAKYAGMAIGHYGPGDRAGFIFSTLGAILLLVIYGFIKGRGPASTS